MALMAGELIEDLQFDFAHEPEHVLLATEIVHDFEARLAASRFIGACISREEVDLSFAEPAEHVSPIESLYDALQLAAEGDQKARSMVTINIATDVIERTTKAGHVMKVELDVDEAGRIQQFGQSMESVHANSLRYASNNPQMLARTKAETLNAFRIAEYHQQGLLDEYNVVVFSRAADDMSEPDMRDAGFFVDTMSVAIQVTTAEDQIITTESAFVAGKKAPNLERHDAETVVAVGNRIGVDLSQRSATQLLETPLLIHKSVIPNGVIDLVVLYDQAAGNTFFGEDKPAHDYYDYRVECRQREARFQPLVERITDQLVAEAPTITSRLHASERLDQLSQDHMVQQAVVDNTIDPQVFGPAAGDIERARYYFEQQQYDQALLAVGAAKQNAVSSSCPNGKNTGSQESLNGDGRDSDDRNDEPDDCEFVSKQCPKCHKKNVHTVISKGKISGSCGCTAKLT